MKPANCKHQSRLAVRLGVAVTALLCLGLLTSSPASAAYEQVEHFAGTPGATGPIWPEEVQLGGLGGMAVNYTGAGGVPAGTLYTVRWGLVNDNRTLVSRYNPDGSFSERWTFEGSPTPNERCGPEGDPAHPTCTSNPSAGEGSVDVDIDQSTGNVYVESHVLPGENQIHVYTPDGSALIAEFGEKADVTETVAATPGKVHRDTHGGIAVNNDGEVYVSDPRPNEERIMTFEPQSAGDYAHYVYAGQSHDILRTSLEVELEYPVADAAGDLYVASEPGHFAKLDPATPSAPPLCRFFLQKGGIKSITVNPLGGELFFSTYKDHETLHELGSECKEGEFVEVGQIPFSPKREIISGLAFDPSREYEPGRPAGVLYAGSPSGEGSKNSSEVSMGYVFSRPPAIPPLVEAESFNHVTATTALLNATINPKGSASNYVFQYLPEAAYEANEPDERQSLSVSATGGVFGLGFQGKRLGGDAKASVTSGSTKLTSLATATATADLKAASGTGDLNGAKGTATTISGSETLTSVSASQGSFETGQGIFGPGIPTGATIVSVNPEGALFEVKISKPATASAAHAAIASGTTKVTALTTSEGAFEVGQAIEGQGIPANTTIASVGASELTLSNPVKEPGSAVALKAGSTTLASLTPGIGSFEVGEAIEGEGIPAGTTVLAVNPTSLKISKPATKPGSGVTLRYPGPDPLAVGEQVEGAGIPSDTTIVALKAGEATLSNPATATGTEVLLHAGLPFDVSASDLQSALQGLPTIGAGNVSVSGGPGDETGSNPYEIVFEGKFENEDVPEIEADGSNLTGGPATAEVQTEHQGGNGFSGAKEAPPGGAFLGEGKEPIAVTEALTGLRPSSGYRFRVLATSHCAVDNAEQLCEGAGPSLAFRTHAAEAPELPDHRAYELVSPTEKGGGQALAAFPALGTCIPLANSNECKPSSSYNYYPLQSAANGESIAYEGEAFDSEHAAIGENEYLARRDPKSGWQSTNLTPTQVGAKPGGYKGFTPTLGSGVLKQSIGEHSPTLSPEAPVGYEDLYVQPSSDPSSLTPLLLEGQFFNRSGGQFHIFYAGASEDLSRIFFTANDAFTEETPFAPEALDGGASKYNLYEWHEGRISLVNVMPGNTETFPATTGFGGAPGAMSRSGVLTNAISADGRRAFFSTESGQVYLREDGETTKEIETEGTPDPGKFLVAAKDGSAVLLKNGHLHSTEGAEETVDLTQGKGGFEGVVGESEDLSHVYFIDTEVLDETPNAEGEEAEGGKDNLYVWGKDLGTRFVARLEAGDNNGVAGYGGSDWAPPYRRTAEASPDGRYLTFLSRSRLTDYDNTGICRLVVNGPPEIYAPGPCPEAFLFDSATGNLVCASCNPTGQQPLSFSTLRLIYRAEEQMPQPRYLTNEGRLLFDSRDSIVPADTNNGVEDVYQYEPNGVGTCEREAGCISLISAGTGVGDSNFLAMDPSGKNVFFTTRDQLTLKDKDQLVDLYDAREEGGIPAESETARGECQGEACQPAVSPPNDPTPGSSTFQGAGNVKETKVAKKHAKKHKKKHSKKKHTHKRAAKHNRGGAK
jgi:hypothetical protein